MPKEFTYAQIKKALEKLKAPQELKQTKLASSCMVKARVRNDQVILTQAIQKVLSEVLSVLEENDPNYADLLRGRYWEGHTVTKMLMSERPKAIAEKTFFNYQKKGIQQFTSIFQQKEEACLRTQQAVEVQMEVEEKPAEEATITLPKEAEEEAGEEEDEESTAKAAQQNKMEPSQRWLVYKVANWQRLGKGRGGLLDELELLEIETWFATDRANELMTEFVKVSQEAIEERKREDRAQKEAIEQLAEEKRNARERIRFLFVMVSITFLMVLSASLLAWLYAQKSANLEQLAMAQALANDSHWQLEQEQDERAALLARQAWLFNQEAQSQILEQVHNALRTVLNEPYFSYILDTPYKKVNSVVFTTDGPLLASGSDHGTIVLQNLSQSNTLPLILRVHDNSIDSLAFSSDGQMLVSGSGDGTIRLWMSAGRAEPVILKAHNATVRALAITPDHQIVASGSEDKTIRLWQVRSPDKEPIVLSGHEAEVLTVAFSPDGRTLASGSADGTIRLWNINNSHLPPIILEGHDSEVRSIAFHPDGLTLASGSADKTVRLWDWQRSQELFVLDQRVGGHTDTVWSLAFTSDGLTLASASSDHTIRLWNMKDGQPKLTTPLHVHRYDVKIVAFSPDKKILASISDDQKVRLWNLEVSSPVSTTFNGTNDIVMNVAFSSDGQRLAAGGHGNDNMVLVWDIDNPTEPALRLSGHQNYVISLAFSPDNRWLASGSADKTIRLWDLNQPGESRVLSDHKHYVRTVLFTLDSMTLASGGEDGTIRLWDLSQPTIPATVLTGHTDWVLSIAFHPKDPSIFASAGSNGEIAIWNMSQPEKPRHFLAGHSGRVRSIAFSPDGTLLASSGNDKTVRLWKNWSTPNSTPIILNGHEDEAWSVSFSRDGKLLASSSLDQTIRLWDVEQQSALSILRTHRAKVRIVTFSPDGPDGLKLASAGDDKQVVLQVASPHTLAEMVCERVKRNLSLDEWNKFVGQDMAYTPTCPDLPLGEGVEE